MHETGVLPVEQAETQAAIVQSTIGDLADLRDGEWEGRPWRRVVVNFEAQWGDGEPVTSVLSFAIAVNPDQSFEKLSFRLSPETKGLLTRLAVQMRAQQGDFWNVSDLVIEGDGSFTFDFSYDPPYRLSGTLNDTRFVDYIERHRAQLLADSKRLGHAP